MSKQKGSVLVIILSSVVIISLVVIGTVMFLSNRSGQNLVATGNNQNPQPVSESTVETPMAQPINNEPVVVTPSPKPGVTNPNQTNPVKVNSMPTPKIPVTSAPNCGSVINTNLYTESGDSALTAQEKISVACISRAFLSCTPAIFTFTGLGDESNYGYEIFGKNGSNCLIAQKKIASPASTKTCKFPISFISQMAQAIKEVNQTDEVFKTVPFLFLGSGRSMTNSQTGEKIILDCSSS